MYLEMKSFFKNKIIKIVLLISLLISFLAVYNIYTYGHNFSGFYENTKKEAIDFKKSYEEEKLYIERNTPSEYKYLAEEMIKSLNWRIETLERLCDLLLDGYRKNERGILKILTYFKLYYMQQNTDYYGGYKYATEIFKDEIDKYLDIEELPFDLYSFENLHNVNWGQIKEKDKLDKHVAHIEDKKILERKFYLLKNNLREVDTNSASPWNYLAYTYSFYNIKQASFIPLVIIISTYIIILSRREKTLQLVKLKPMKKSRIYFHYLKITLLLCLIIILVPDILSIIFMGIKNGFYGLRNPIEIYKDGLSSFKTYSHIGRVAYIRGLGKIYGAGVYKNGNAYEFLGMENIEFYKFLILSFIPSILKIIFFATLGISIGLLIKNKTISLITSSVLTLFTILSHFSGYLRKSFNIFALDSGWEITLGHTEFSWFGSTFLLSISILLIIFFSLFILIKKELE